MATRVDVPACKTGRTVAAVAAEAVARAVPTMERATVMWVVGIWVVAIEAQAVLGTAARVVGTAMHTAQAPFILRFVGMSPVSWRLSS